MVARRPQRTPRSTGLPPRWYVVPLGIFAVSRVICGVLLTLVGRAQTGSGYGGLAPNWDGQWYRYIVEHGYPPQLPTVHGVVQENQWALYPLYPTLVRIVMWPGLSYAVAASCVSIAFGAAAMTLLYRMLAPNIGGFGSAMTVLALCVAPAAVVWQAAYTESLALFLILAALWALRSRRYGTLLVVALALALTRPVVLPLALVAGLHWIMRWRRRAVEPFPPREAMRSACVIVAMGASFLLWPIVAALVTHRPDAYFATQSAWYERNTGWPTWLKVFVGGSDLALMLLVAAVCAALLAIVVRAPARLWGFELRTWAWAYPLYILCSTRPTTSITRYALLAIVPWWPFPEIGQQVTARCDRLALVALVTVLGIASRLVWLRWFWVIGPANVAIPWLPRRRRVPPASAMVRRTPRDLPAHPRGRCRADRPGRARPDPRVGAAPTHADADPGRSGVVPPRDRQLGRPVVPADRRRRLPLARGFRAWRGWCRTPGRCTRPSPPWSAW